jgi:aspartyl aminopeptidase
MKLQPGDKVYASNMGKQLVAFQIGRKPLEEGMNILGAHIDSPRIDVKQKPVYEDKELVYLNTHYYGGIKKYQWVTIPLAIHGVIAKKDGTVIQVCIGENEADPVFCITDLLIHLSEKQMVKTAATAVEGENLDLLVGNLPISKDDWAEVCKQRAAEETDEEERELHEKEAKKLPKEAAKEELLKLLAERYDVTEEDFLSAELEIVPAGKARDAGLDSSMILGYGHDDRVCAYPSLIALLESSDLERTGVCILADKEEIGSMGATGMHSRFFENMVAEVIALTTDYSDLKLRRALTNSCMLSSDVSAGYDPLYANVFDVQNAAYIGHGVCFNKYTGSRGKSGSNDANAEYMARLRAVLDEDQVCFQTAELGKVDAGGGGTIAYICANLGMQVIDSGIAVLSMHAPWELISKADIYEAKKCYETFLKKI